MNRLDADDWDNATPNELAAHDRYWAWAKQRDNKMSADLTRAAMEDVLAAVKIVYPDHAIVLLVSPREDEADGMRACGFISNLDEDSATALMAEVIGQRIEALAERPE